jgi:hypothetical protein
MYKKVTHHIVEEHFAPPIASEIKKVVDKTKPTPKPKLDSISPMTAADFQQALATWRTHYQEGIDKIIRSVTGTEEDLKFAEELSFSEVNRLGDLLRPIYGIDLAEKVNQGFRSYILGLVQVVHLLRSGLDIRDWTNNRFNNLVAGDLFGTLNAVNNTWGFQNIRNGLVSMSDAWVSAMKARMAKKTDEENRQMSTATNALKNFLADIYNGTTTQYPEKFLTPTPMPTISRDIM